MSVERIRIGYKKPQLIHLAYAGTFSNNLYADTFEAILDPEFGMSLDLNKNLRTKNKGENSYLDAKELADGKIQMIEAIQITEESTIRGLSNAAPQRVPESWMLEIQLAGTHLFRVRPEMKFDDLFLYVEERLRMRS